MEKILDIKVAKNMGVEFNKISRKIDPYPLNLDTLILNRLFHQTSDIPDKSNFN